VLNGEEVYVAEVTGHWWTTVRIENHAVHNHNDDPYTAVQAGGTIFMDSDWIPDNSQSVFDDLTYTGSFTRMVFDRRTASWSN